MFCDRRPLEPLVFPIISVAVHPLVHMITGFTNILLSTPFYISGKSSPFQNLRTKRIKVLTATDDIMLIYFAFFSRETNGLIDDSNRMSIYLSLTNNFKKRISSATVLLSVFRV